MNDKENGKSRSASATVIAIGAAMMLIGLFTFLNALPGSAALFVGGFWGVPGFLIVAIGFIRLFR